MLQIVPKPEQNPENTTPRPGATADTTATANGDDNAVATVYNVSGMSCAHCANAVTEELTALPGVASVQVDIAAGTVTVRSAHALPEPDVRTAIDEAGYKLV
jgi:copper chaperone CopZ